VLAASKRPVAVLDEMGGFPSFSLDYGRQYNRVLQTGAFATGLTAYHFRVTRFAPILLGYLLDSGLRAGAKDREEVDGVLIARRSTGATG